MSGTRHFARVAHLTACATMAATISFMAAAGPAPALTSSRAALAGLDAFQPHRSREPAPVRGLPLGRATGLRLVVADNPPFVLDVDRGSVSPVAGVRAMKRGVLWVVAVGGRGGVAVARSSWRRADLYAVRGREARVSALGTGTDVVPASDGRSVWVKGFSRSHCTLRQVGLDGRQMRVPRPFRCTSTIYPAGSLGLVVNRTRVIDPLTGRTILKTRWGVLAVAGARLLLAGPGKRFTLIDAATRFRRRLPWPSILSGLGGPAVQPRGRLVALAFADPAWRGGGKQALDVWLLDTKTAKLTQLPGMPAFVSLKFTSMAWTNDGRLVLLGESNEKDVVVVWRPGQRRLALKPVRLPARTSGSDSFAPLR
jgi:hypothetical protein